ncbi:unnamed protein product [Adineta steineri]|uniref:Autophagy-related protein 2 n=1 Tax=Adineta steineri TaxID=433720 RepID=A0A814C8R5_9BILA|nr:unnamed protein product [Adineta steineri]
MPWQSFIPWSNSLKTRACRQLIHHYLGVFFQEKLSLDQLSVDLFSGRGQVKDVILNLNALNESLTNNNIPFEVVKAYVGEINLLIPWTSLLRDNSLLDIKDLEITIRPKQTNDQNATDASFELSSMFNSMNTSMLIAQECLKNETEEDTTYQGLETFAATIDSILARVKVTLIDTVIRLEHLIDNNDHGVALEIRIKKFEYFDSEATSIDMTVASDTNSIMRPTVFTNKNFVLSGVTLYTDEFSIHKDSSNMTDSSELNLPNRSTADSMTSSALTNSSSSVMTTTSNGNTRMFGYETFDPVLCLTISGKQDIRLKLKQSEQIYGPKVEIEAHCGSVNCLLTPKQLQSLIILLTAYQKAALNSTGDSNLYNSSSVNNRPMTEDDFRRIEQNLAEEIRKKNCQMGSQQYDNDYYHYSDVEQTPDPSESMFCSVKGMSTSIDLESSYTSSHPDSASTSSHRRRSSPHRNSSTNQSTVDKAHLKQTTKRLLEQSQSIISTKCRLQFNFISLCLLHRDIETSSTSLKDFADSYFSNIATINTSGMLDDRQINEHRLKYSQACLQDHISLIGKPLIIDFIQQSAENCLCLELDIRFSSVDLCECLLPENTNVQQRTTNENKQMIFNRLLSFNRTNEANFDSLSSFQVPYNGIQSSIQISLTNFDINETKKKKSVSAFSRRLATLRPFSDVNIRLASCQIDFDVSIIDRIYSTINACQTNNSSTTNQNSSNSLTMLSISSPGCILNLRFPIADLQPLSKRRPWWIQAIHKEILTFDLKQVNFQSDFDIDETTTLTITSESIQVYFMDNINSERSHIAQLSSSNGEIIKLIINLNDLKNFAISQLNPVMTDTLFDSIFCRLPTNDNKLPLKNKNTLNDNRQVLEVADADTIHKFISSCSQETKLNIHIIIPYILFYIPNQVFLDTIYNRFVNNLFMWESSAPINNDNLNQMYATANYGGKLINSLGNTTNEQAFQTCRSIIKRINSNSSDDDQVISDEDDDDQGGLTPRGSKKKGPHSFVLHLNVQDIHVAANAPMGDKIPRESRARNANIGEFRIDGQGLTLAIVDGYQGDVNLQYFCLLSHSALLYHNGNATAMKSNISLHEVLSRSLPELLTRLPSDAFPKYNNNGTMVRAAFEIRSTGDRSEGKQKMIRGSFTVEGAMLHQKILPKEEIWLLQLMELFDFTDEEVAGYIPSVTLVDWHLEFRHCAIYYRPLYSDTRCFVALDSLAVTNTIVKSSKTTLIEINLEDWAIYLSKQKRDRHQIDLLNDYISVINGGAFEIKLYFNEPTENMPMNDPLLDIRIACNMIHIRTCSDSANALSELLKYVVTHGDLQQQQQQQQQTHETGRSSTPIERVRIDRPVRMMSEETINNEQSKIDDTSHQEKLLADAMADDYHEPIGSMNESGIKYHSNENAILNSHSSDVECGSVFSSSTYGKDDDDDDDSLPIIGRQVTYSGEINRDFELIEPEVGMCRPPENGLYEVHVLSETPIQIHENHFPKPLERNDILNAPAHLPVPTLRFSIRQISIVWHIYGGSDFALPKPNDSHQQPVQLNINESVRFNAASALSPTQEKAGGRLYSSYDTTRLARHERGGPCRDLRTSMEFSISKARCQYETYDEQEKASSRFVFAIHEFEIRDRLLARSEINKFLYLYTTEAAPRRTHADMLVVKILNTKPEGYLMKTLNDEFENGINPNLSAEPLECEIKVSLQPLRINIDQDTLVFMRNFFVNLTNTTNTREISPPIPVTTESNINNDYPSSSLDSDLSTSSSSHYAASPILNTTTINAGDTSSSSTNSTVFIKHFVFSPACHIRIDYRGKLRNEQLFDSGPFLNLLIGLAQLAKVDIYLKRISYKRGLLGYEKLLTFLLNEWLTDIHPTDVIKGIVPLSSISQIILGIKDLFYLPIDQYRRDGRVLRGIQRGASSFTTSTALALIELSSQVVRCAHFAALLCFELVSSSTIPPNEAITSNSSPSSSSSNQTIMVRNHPPPNDIREGVTYAVNVIRQSFNTTSHQLRTEAQLGRRRKGVLGVVGGLLRQMPSVAIQPIVTTTKAAENFLVGVRNQIDRDERNDDKEKYRSEHN